MDRKSLRGRKNDLREVLFTTPIPLHTSKVPCFESCVLDTKSVKQCFLRVIVMLFSYVLQRNSNYHSACLPFKSVLCSSRVHCARIVPLAAAVCLSHVIDTLPLFSPHRRFRAASTHQWSCVRGCVSANTAVWTARRATNRDEGRRGEKNGAKGDRCPARLACTALEHSGGKHLGCGRFFADQTLCQVKEKKKKKGRARENRTLQTVLGRLEHLYNPNEVRLDA